MLKGQEIEKILNLTYRDMTKTYGGNRILGTFITGNVNYGFAENADELNIVTIYLPSFNELCLGTIISEKNLIDIRTIYSLFESGPRTLELLFCKYKIINPIYENVYNIYFDKQKEKIAKVNPRYRLEQAWNRITESFLNEDNFEGMRLYIAAKMYIDGRPCEECFHITDPIYSKYLRDIKKSNIIDYDINNALFELRQSIDNVPEEDIDAELVKIVQSGIIELVSCALREMVSIDAFESSLTSTELKAWRNIYKKLRLDKDITIALSTAIDETGISRPVWKSLLTKMEKSKVADIENHGVKGTRIILKENVK